MRRSRIPAAEKNQEAFETEKNEFRMYGELIMQPT